MYRRGESSPRLSNPRATGFENDFYTMIGPDGQRDTTMEELLAQRVDGPTSAIWHKLLDPSQQLTPDERAQVAIFIAFLFTRTSSLRRMLQDVFAELEEKTRILLDKRANDPTWRPVPLTPGVPAYPISSPEDLKLTQNDLVASVLSGVEEVAQIVSQMNWTFVHAPFDSHFITSDNPVARHNPFTKDLRLLADITKPGIEITVPISKNCCLVCSYHGPEGHIDVEAHGVDLINRRTLTWADSEVYSSTREEWLDREFFGDPPK